MPPVPPSTGALADEDIGFALGIALVAEGRYAEAESVLERLTRRCDALTETLETMRGLLALGEAREKLSNEDGARAAYKRIVAVWGKAKPPSITADAAKKRLAAMR
jgi:serine/threonine-protein kinase